MIKIRIDPNSCRYLESSSLNIKTCALLVIVKCRSSENNISTGFSYCLFNEQKRRNGLVLLHVCI